MLEARLILTILLVTTASACGTSSSSSGINKADKFDLSLYFFHANTQTPGGEISFVENFYERPSGSGPIESNATTLVNTGSGIEDEFNRYVITDNTIEDISITATGSRTLNRFAAPGETYTNDGFEELFLNENCTLRDHYDTFDLSTATGAVTIATDVHEDVIQVRCDSFFTLENGGTKPNYTWDQYYAKGIGLIFLDGTWPNLHGDVFAIPEY